MENLKCQNKKNIFGSKTFSICLLALVLVVALILFSVSPVFALTATNNSAYKAGNGAELWNNDTRTFNQTVLKDIQTKIFGNENPVSYIKENTDAKEYASSNSYVLPASKINEKIGNVDNGMVVTLGGKKWMVACLTLADTPTSKNNVVMTLYLADNEGASRYSLHDVNSSGSDAVNRGLNMYSASEVRKQLLTGDNWSMFSRGYFADEYLVQPKYIGYQVNQKREGRDNGDNLKNESVGIIDGVKWFEGNNYHWHNGANGTVGSGAGFNWSGDGKHTPYRTDEVFDGARYDDWGNDTIWLPSMTEVGALKEGENPGYTYIPNDCVWKLSQNQRKHTGTKSDGTVGTTTDSWSWFRSGDTNFYCGALVLGASGAYADYWVSGTYGVRPALHLNLSSAVLSTAAEGIAPTQASGYDYQYLNEKNTRQNYADINYKHGVNDKNAARNVLGNIKPNTNVTTFVNNLKNANSLIQIYDNKGTLVYDKGTVKVANAIIGTGYRVELYSGTTKVDTVYTSVLGDVIGDGRIGAADIAYLRNIALDKTIFTNLSLEKKLAALIINVGEVTTADAEIARNVLDGKIKLEYFYFINR